MSHARPPRAQTDASRDDASTRAMPRVDGDDDDARAGDRASTPEVAKRPSMGARSMSFAPFDSFGDGELEREERPARDARDRAGKTRDGVANVDARGRGDAREVVGLLRRYCKTRARR